MTDTIDVAALVERLKRRQESRWDGVSQDHEWVPDADCVAAATALQSQADALAEARRELKDRDKVFCAMLTTGVCDLPDRLATAEASLATMREALEAMVQRFELYAGPGDMHAGHHDLELLKISRAALAKEGK